MTRATDHSIAAFRVAAALPADTVEQARQAVNAAIAGGDGIAQFRQRLQQVPGLSSLTPSELARSDEP